MHVAFTEKWNDKSLHSLAKAISSMPEHGTQIAQILAQAKSLGLKAADPPVMITTLEQWVKQFPTHFEDATTVGNRIVQSLQQNHLTVSNVQSVQTFLHKK